MSDSAFASVLFGFVVAILLALTLIVTIKGSIKLFDWAADVRHGHTMYGDKVTPESPNSHKFCQNCGRQLIMYSRFIGFDSQTGEPNYYDFLGCPTSANCVQTVDHLGPIQKEHNHPMTEEGSIQCRRCLNDLVTSGQMTLEDACLLIGLNANDVRRENGY